MQDIHALSERAKELRCLYAIDSIVSDRAQTPPQVFERVLEEIPSGWQRTDTTGARIEYLGRQYVGPGFDADGHTIAEPIRLWNNQIGELVVSTRSDDPDQDADSFLAEEHELLRRIAGRLGEYLEWKHGELLSERSPRTSTHWAWRERYAQALADSIDPGRFGVSKMYLGGSTARGDARGTSDIDLYIRCDGSDRQQAELAAWIDGWSLCLAEVALQHTGHSFPGGIINVQWLVAEPGVHQRAELQELKIRRIEESAAT
ncbi:nucleotidyltransferase domain-containing protein [Adonisia turfae]